MNRKARRAAARSLTLPKFLSEYAAVEAVEEDVDTANDATEEVTEEKPLPRYWSGVIGVEGELTGDGRLIETGALTWDTPIPLRFVAEDVGAHEGAATSGRILNIERDENGLLQSYGDFDLGSEQGREAARLVRDGLMNGVSMDLDSIEFEVRISKEKFEEQQAFWEAVEEGDIPEEDIETDEDGRVVVFRGGSSEELMVMTSARVRAATQVSIPAFTQATIRAEDTLPDEIMALIASAAPVNPPSEWFSIPEPDRPTALTITDEGMISGHLATWDTCHIADPSGAGICVMAPKSKSDYAYFHVGAVRTEEGTQVPTGVIRFRTGHAPLRASADSAQAHYDNTGLAGADVHVVDGKYGVWVSGAIRPGLSEEQLRELRAAPLSGDWRYINGNLELVGALAVNLPGFPVPRPSGLVASGELTGLVAAGLIAPNRAPSLSISDEDARYLSRIIERERQADAAAVAKAREKVDLATARRKIEKLAIRRKVRGR